MDKKAILEIVSEKIKKGEISREEIFNLIDKKDSIFGNNSVHKISNILYTVGSLIIFAGLFFFFSQFWDSIGSITKVFSTLGFGLIAFIVSMVIKSREHVILPAILSIFSAIFIPFGIGVYLDVAGKEVTILMQSLIFFALTIIFLVAHFVSKRNLNLFFGMVFGFLTYNLLINFYLLETVINYAPSIREISWMIISLSYGYIGYLISKTNSIDEFDKKSKNNLVGILYFTSVIGLISPMFGDGAIVYILGMLVLVGLFYLSVFVKSTSMLFSTSIMFLIYLSTILVEYFSNIFGVSLIIILIGMIMVSTGFVTFRINSKLINN